MGPLMEARVVGIMIGIFVGAILAMVIGFKMVGWATPTSLQTQVDAAVLGTRSEICAAQFMRQTNNGQKLKEFALVAVNDRADFIEKGGWDKMPGQETASWGVSRACVTGLEALIKQ
jgi:hypothetical protein